MLKNQLINPIVPRIISNSIIVRQIHKDQKHNAAVPSVKVSFSIIK